MPSCSGFRVLKVRQETDDQDHRAFVEGIIVSIKTHLGRVLALTVAALAANPFLAASSLAADEMPVTGGTLIYLEQQAHTNLYPPAGGFYPNGGILNQITYKL